MPQDTQPKQGRRKQGRHPERVLSAGFVRTVTQPGRYLDGLGLSLLVTKTGGRCWIQRLTINGHLRELGLGGYPLTSLAQAREKALANKRLVREGGDPLAEKHKAPIPTFAEAAAAVIALHRPGWRNAKHAAQWEASLAQYVFPRLGERGVHHHDGGYFSRFGTHLARKSGDGTPGPATHRGGDEMGGRARISHR